MNKNTFRSDFMQSSKPEILGALEFGKIEEDPKKRIANSLGLCLSGALFSLFIMLYLVIINLKLDGYLTAQFLWTYTFPAQIIALLSLVSMIHYNRRIKNLNMHPVECLINTLLVSLVALGSSFVLLLDLKMDNLIDVDYGIVFIPFDVLLAVSFLCVCFVLPGYFVGDKTMIIDATLLLVYYTVGVIWTVFMVMRLDGSVHWSYVTIFSIPFVGMLTHCVLLLVELKERETKEILRTIGILLWICLCLGLIMVNLNGKVLISWNFVLIPLYISNLYFFIYVISDTFLGSRTSDNSGV